MCACADRKCDRYVLYFPSHYTGATQCWACRLPRRRQVGLSLSCLIAHRLRKYEHFFVLSMYTVCCGTSMRLCMQRWYTCLARASIQCAGVSSCVFTPTWSLNSARLNERSQPSAHSAGPSHSSRWPALRPEMTHPHPSPHMTTKQQVQGMALGERWTRRAEPPL